MLTALVERNDKGDMIHVGYKPCLDSSHTRVGILKQTIVALQNICLWPTSKSRHDVNKIDLTFFTDDPQQRYELINKLYKEFLLSSVIFILTIYMYQKTLSTVFVIRFVTMNFTKFSKKIK